MYLVSLDAGTNMYFKVTGILLTITVGLVTGSFLDRKDLFKILLRDYQKDLAPAGKGGGPVVVYHSLFVNAFESLENNVLTLQTWEWMSWNDNRLQWDLGSYGDEKTLFIPSKLVWQPDILLMNSVEQFTGFAAGDLNVIVYHDGNVTFVPIRHSKTLCPFNMESIYRENEVNCSLKYMSWAHSSKTLDTHSTFQTVQNLSQMTPNRLWEIVDTKAERNELTFSCCNTEVYPEIEYTLTIKRLR
ncbi:neuronal acetylcholine receptor subunit alpha-7-like [Mercenaria mercenaria]|uniref:neuronal acetylcholine receptor subunit alpha-7-like n=1 Tax=Mercenaria mercenaria TaxID=6596 RepID=UPI00234F5615|nr:neuronal acetylcholine receptor subunit alpha-7-like [Mercenaria mercenaria]